MSSDSQQFTGGDAAPGGEKIGPYAYYVLGVLSVSYILNFMDRNIISALIEPIKAELKVSDTAMGVLSGFAFTIFYSAMAIPFARLADRTNRRNLIASGIAFWSVMTSACGFAQNYLQLFIGRVGVGVGEAATTSAVYSILADYFPAKRRALAMGIYSAAIFVGVMLSITLGGYLAQTIGWRMAFLLLGPPGLVLSLLLLLTVREPTRGGHDPAELGPVDPQIEVRAKSISHDLRELLAIPAFASIVAGMAATSISLGGFATWAPAFLVRVHGMSLIEVGQSFGWIVGIFGTLGTVAGGLFGALRSRSGARLQLGLVTIACLITFPAMGLFALSDNVALALAAYAAAMVFSGIQFGPSFAIMLELVRPEMRAFATSLTLFTTAMIGQGAGPMLTGLLNDLLRSEFGPSATRYSLTIAAAFMAVGGLFFWLAARTVAADRAGGGCGERLKR